MSLKRLLLVLCMTALSILFSISAGEKPPAEFDRFYEFLQAVDPQNVLRISPNGTIPNPCLNRWKGVMCNAEAASIYKLSFENMNLSGTIDTNSLCQLPNLRSVSLASNFIRGSIQDSISNCTSLIFLNLSSNHLSGELPGAFTKMKNLKVLDISGNNLNGIARNSRADLEVSSPDTPTSDAVNSAPPLPDPHKSENKTYTWLVLVLGVGLYFILIYWASRHTAKSKRERVISKTVHQQEPQPQQSPFKFPPAKVRDHHEHEAESCEDKRSNLVFFVEEEERFKLDDLLEAAADLQNQNLCSSLYKVTLKNNAVYAVKRLKKLQVSLVEKFGQTMRRVGTLKHPNILPLVAYNSSEAENLLIYKYQTNGSLLALLDNYIEGKREFPWRHRLSVISGIAQGLNFIHQSFNDQEKTVPHGNLKLSNVLLGEAEEPMISEYGFSMYLEPNKGCFKSSGYQAPERGLSEKGDVFSFGVILLELLTGKNVEKSGIDLPKWVRAMVREEWTGEVFDKEINRSGNSWAFSLLEVALKCVSISPEDRPTMGEVLEKIQKVVRAQDEAPASPSGSVESNHQDSCCFLHTVLDDTWDTPGSNY